MLKQLVVVGAVVAALGAQTVDHPARAVTDPGVVTTRQAITPAGVPTVFNGRVYGAAFGAASSEVWVLHASHVYRLDWKQNRVLDAVPHGGSPGLQGIRFDKPGGGVLAAVAVRERRRSEPPAQAEVRLIRIHEGQAATVASGLGTFLAGAIAIATQTDTGGRRLALIPITANNKLAVIDLASGKSAGTIPTELVPFGAVLSRDGSVAYVSNWGGRPPKPGDLTAPLGLRLDADRAVVDERGIASTGTVTRMDLKSMKATHTIPAELHPTALAWDEQRNRLYVANANTDSISVIDTQTQTVAAAFPLVPFAVKAFGIAPTALVLSPDGARLYVACGGINAVMLLDAATGRIEGMIPTAWYPNGLALSSDGKLLAVTSLLGAGSGWRDEPRKRFVHSYRGALNVIEIPDKAQLASYTTVVAENNRLPLPGSASERSALPAADAKPVAIPARAGEPSLIEHVVFIIKENRTYDQVFGALPQGNGDPSLVMFGRDVTPNHHKLAEQFVVIDNFYATGGNSADGHQWLTQANEVAYCLWPGYAGRSYPFDGSDPLAYSHSGFLWDAALARGKTVRVYGEYAGRLPVPSSERQPLLERWRNGEDFTQTWNITAPIDKLNTILARNYPTYTTHIPDVVRAQIFLADFRKMEEEGRMPNLVLIQLPSNHTNGAQPGISSAKAMVADNDLAMGKIVEALSRSKFWPKMAIFVVEDDAQNGVDHVDGHRTVALVASPYTKRGAVDSTFYSTQSMVKTIELILGLPTLSLFDLIAHDMRNSFTDTPDLTPYKAEEPAQSLFEQNPAVEGLKGPAREAALASMKMRFDVPDAAPSDRLNRILWHQVRGWNTPYPGTRSAVFAPLSLDLDDDEREEAGRE